MPRMTSMPISAAPSGITGERPAAIRTSSALMTAARPLAVYSTHLHPSTEIPVTAAEVIISIPRRDNKLCSRFAMSRSNPGRISRQYSTTVTFTPNSANIQANSTPMTPPPITHMLSGTDFKERSPSLVRACSVPSIGRTEALEPVAITIMGA